MSRIGFRLLKEKDYLNPLEWEERLFFTEMKNKDIATMTAGAFGDTRNPFGTHPVFLLRKIEAGAFEFCPCSSKDYNKDKASYIRQNSKTAPKGMRVDKNSYILHFISFNLTSDCYLVDRLPLLGLVAEDDIVGDFHKQRGIR